jgi:hypothetical protein
MRERKKRGRRLVKKQTTTRSQKNAMKTAATRERERERERELKRASLFSSSSSSCK